MPKIHWIWPNKTLFIQWWKYKWSYKYDHCTECLTCEFQHKGKGLCTRCHDKKRSNNPIRKEQLLKASRKISEKRRIPAELHKKKWPKPTWFDQKQYHQEWYQKWKEAILLLRKWVVLQKKWHILPLYKGKPIPFAIDRWSDSYEEYKERIRKFEVVKKYLDK